MFSLVADNDTDFYVVKNGLPGYPCYCSNMTKEKRRKSCNKGIVVVKCERTHVLASCVHFGEINGKYCLPEVSLEQLCQKLLSVFS